MIEQAKGVLAERARVSVDVAFMRMRGYARTNNLKLGDVAHRLIDGQLEPALVTTVPPPGG